ncbi:TonB-dependent receptor [Sphingomonas gilva]|uniref:TonB-dependent receptor n=1 Tax=Sphingomonas gilva TaxID=2305907 RepID=A0A396RXX5_9SPHN|nr:TonB-dependent receptor [Sphingomonas gilva]RHW19323.1 TonB-dependent receptor [Sphingomonas gilva]
MSKLGLVGVSTFALLAAAPAWAQDTSGEAPSGTAQSVDQAAPEQGGIADIIVTAQRQSQRLQDVPIAVTAFTAEALEEQQIENASDLQITLPNVTFTKTNFTSSSFTIRGIGDLCVGVTCDSATGIHINDMPLQNTRLFEAEYFDLERIEVLRGPQGTLFGRNATSGVVNFITARPDLSGFGAAGEFEYGNYDSIKGKAMINLPIGETLGIRLAGTYVNRDGYTYNQFDDTRIDDRDLFALRGTLRWEPGPDTTLDLIGYYFREDDNRSRIQKQLCHRDPTGILGCQPDRLENETLNGNATLAAIQSSREFLGIVSGGLLTGFGLGSVYGPDVFAGVVNPEDARTVRVDYTPTYFAEEEQYTLKLMHDFGPVSLNVTGGYSRGEIASRSDYLLAVENPYVNNPGLFQLAGAAALDPATWGQLAENLIPNGPNGGICQSDADPNGVGVHGGNSVGCFASSLDFDESSQSNKQYSAEAHIDSSFDGMFNFLLGGIYFQTETFDNNYFVNSFGLDYASGLLGAANTGGAAFFATPFYRNHTKYYRLKSFGIFGETYFDLTDQLKLTLGLRYNDDQKFVRARTTYLVDSAGVNPVVPYGSDSLEDALNYPALDFNASVPGVQEFSEAEVSFSRLTGRAVLDYQITPDNLIYASYSRGYKSGGINPPLSPVFAVETTFLPETVDAFEIGSKNTFGNGTFRLNLTAFYYKYQNLQLSRIVARTSVNDNVNADIYGVEAEAIVSPIPAFVVNMNASYLNTKVKDDKFLSNPRDPSGGRSDVVIIKDVTNASNCAVAPTAGGSAAIANGFVAQFNQAVGLAAPVAVPGTSATGAFSICANLAAAAAAGVPVEVLGSGVAVNIRDNHLPQAPEFKFSVGAQYTIDLGDSGMTIVPRADLAYTGNSYGTIFNRNIDRIPGYEVVNAQIQLNGAEDRWYARAFVQNLTENNAITGMYVTDQSSGLFTNVFTLEPRRYGAAIGFKF